VALRLWQRISGPKRCQKKAQPSEVLVKVAALNALYHAAILALETVAKHIVSLNIDAPLAAGDLSVVGKIARVKVGIKGRAAWPPDR